MMKTTAEITHWKWLCHSC